MLARRIGLSLVLALALAPACANRVWDSDALAVRYPGLAAHPGHRLADLHPYVLPRAATLVLFTCRWDTAAPIGVWLSAEFEPAERVAVEAALAAWQGAGLGVRFLPVEEEEASLRIEIREEGVERAAGTGSGVAFADCALGSAGVTSGTRLDAQLVSAQVELARQASGPPGLARAHSPEELAGAALHELGHALGFQGHADRGETAMRGSPELVRAWGRRVLAGEAVEDPSLAALYALPNGSVLDARPVSRWRTDLVDRMAQLAQREALDGPYLRVGDTVARVFWRQPDGARNEYGLQIVNLGETYLDPTKVLVVAEPLTRRALPRSRDLAPR